MHTSGFLFIAQNLMVMSALSNAVIFTCQETIAAICKFFPKFEYCLKSVYASGKDDADYDADQDVFFHDGVDRAPATALLDLMNGSKGNASSHQTFCSRCHLPFPSKDVSLPLTSISVSMVQRFRLTGLSSKTEITEAMRVLVNDSLGVVETEIPWEYVPVGDALELESINGTWLGLGGAATKEAYLRKYPYPKTTASIVFFKVDNPCTSRRTSNILAKKYRIPDGINYFCSENGAVRTQLAREGAGPSGSRNADDMF
jgi:hypothetical protein